MISLDVRADLRQAEQMLDVTPAAVRRAAARAINDVLITLRADGAREIQKAHPALRIGDIKRALGYDSATAGDLRGNLFTTGRPLSMLLYQVRGGRHLKSGGTTPLMARLGAGPATTLSYHGRLAFRIAAYGNEVFVRRDAHGRGVRRLRGPSMPGVFRAQSERFKTLALARWKTTFPNRLQYEIERANG
jgi:hypothetical protein